ncbi:hypothetical protein EB1_33680 [Empedobacter brevis NBRC 14943 = ATCC 43319]|uniref:DUF3945 domain-containing protein n=1 Tax=Empedobacter brevis NBRC 14943 = ATCC 43319 TaxID=1218108 RepID=A0A511NMA2_9FLAO|nr:DUF3945 domain-containing protein [Empedobacter brevis]GEM53578.1 hypothetical protein EB1_33680 [Empedobacter brevis NBRC 14943 = ATCC 43319]
MSEIQTQNSEQTAQLSDILLVLDKEKMKIQAIKSFDKNGQMETVDPTKKNQNKFMQINKHGDFLSNFFSNFYNQLKNPTNFAFFKVPDSVAIEKAKEFQKHFNHPISENEKEVFQYEILPNAFQQNHSKNNNMETEKTEYRFNPEQIDWETMNNLGLSKERLEKINQLDPLLKGYKTNQLIPVSINFGSAVLRTDIRLSLQQSENGTIVPALHGIRKEPNLNYEFFGHKFTDEDKKNLLETGNMGRVVDLTNTKTGENIPSIISVDRLTNELIALKTEFIKIPDEIKGVLLNKEQKQTLKEGKSLYLEGMTSVKGTEFSANVQFNADKRYVEFQFDNKINKVQNIKSNREEFKNFEAPKIFRNKELSEQQHNELKDGKTVFIDGLIDKRGQTYQGYISFNKELGKTQFMFPNQLKEAAQPSEEHKTQVAVNSEGKTNESTKQIKTPLESKQQSPKEKQSKKSTESLPKNAKSKGRKV